MHKIPAEQRRLEEDWLPALHTPSCAAEFALLHGPHLRLYIAALPITSLNEQGRHIHNTNPGS